MLVPQGRPRRLLLLLWRPGRRLGGGREEEAVLDEPLLDRAEVIVQVQAVVPGAATARRRPYIHKIGGLGGTPSEKEFGQKGK